MAKLKIIVDGSGKIQVFDERPDPSSQEEWKSRSDEIDALVAEIQRDSSITEKELEV